MASRLVERLDAAIAAAEDPLLREQDAAQLASWRRWPQMSAMQEEGLLLVPDKGLERPSGQMIEATARLCALLEAKGSGSR